MANLRSYLYPIGIFGMYAAAIQFTGACLAYSQAMLDFSKIPYRNLQADGGIGRGKVAYVKRNGFFAESFYIRLKDNPHHFIIPASVSEAPAGEAPSAPTPNLGKLLEEGTDIQIRTWGEGRPGWGVVLGLDVANRDGALQKVLDYEISARRHVAAIQNSPEVARRYKNVAWLPIPLALAFHLLVLRRFRKKQAA